MGPLTKFFGGRLTIEALFIERDGQCVTYPHGIFGRGVILDEDQKAQWEKYNISQMEISYWAMIISIIVIAILIFKYSMNLFLTLPIILVLGGLDWIYYEITCRKILAGAKRTSKKFTFGDYVEHMAEVLSWRRIVRYALGGVVVNCIFIAVFSMYLYTVYSHSADVELSHVIVWGISQIFLLSLSVLSIKILIRKRHQRANSAKPDQPAGHC